MQQQYRGADLLRARIEQGDGGCKPSVAKRRGCLRTRCGEEHDKVARLRGDRLLCVRSIAISHLRCPHAKNLRTRCIFLSLAQDQTRQQPNGKLMPINAKFLYTKVGFVGHFIPIKQVKLAMAAADGRLQKPGIS